MPNRDKVINISRAGVKPKTLFFDDTSQMLFLFLLCLFFHSSFTHAINEFDRDESARPIILCYGDSLTAGMTPERNYFPYPSFLEEVFESREENFLYGDVKVEWIGLPGWTAKRMVETKDFANKGLEDALKHRYENVKLVVILAGTNDLGYSRIRGPASSSKILEVSSSIANWIETLHEISHNFKVPSLAISIPGSAFQTKNAGASEVANKVNLLLEDWCTVHNDLCLYMQFPFQYENSDKNWSKDGLHLSKAGYRALAEKVAPMIQTAMICLGTENSK